MTNTTTPLIEALALALRLSPLDKIRLLEQVASTLERDLAQQPATQTSADKTWGQQLVALVNQLDLSDWDTDDDVDPGEWLKRQRELQVRERLSDWDGRS